MAATSIASLMRSATRCGRGLVPALEAVSGGGIHIHSARSAAGACTRLATAVEAHAASRVMRSHASSPTAFLIGSVRTGASLSLSPNATSMTRTGHKGASVQHTMYLVYDILTIFFFSRLCRCIVSCSRERRGSSPTRDCVHCISAARRAHK